MQSSLGSVMQKMDSIAAYKHYQDMKQNQLLFSYCGALNHELMTAILQVSDSKLREMQANNRKKKNVINILIECLQNVIFHGKDEKANSELSNVCLVALGKEDENYVVLAGNHLTDNSAKKLKSKLDEMTELDQEQIHQLYLEQLSKGELSEKGGAGLGILRILRESGQKLIYNFSKTPEGQLFFSIQISITHLDFDF